MKLLLPALLAAAVLAGGCTSNNGATGDPDSAGKPDPRTPEDVEREKRRVLELLRVFEGRSLDDMERACVEFREIGKPIVSDEILDCVDRFLKPATQANAHERLRFLSKLARHLLLLETHDPEAWKACYEAMIRLGPEATTRFATVLILKSKDNPLWCRGMLMDLMVEVPLAQDVVMEALRVKFEKGPSGALTEHVIDDSMRLLLATALLGLPDPPADRIRNLALDAPAIGTRRAFASKLDEVRGSAPAGATLPWATALLVELLQRDAAWQVRAGAAESLGRTGDPVRAVPALTIALKDRDHWVRRSSCRGLATLGAAARDATGPLIAMLEGLDTERFPTDTPGETDALAGNPRRELEEAGVAALQRLTGKQFREVESFILWWKERNR